MSITTSGVAHVINTIEDLLAIIESQGSLSINTGCDDKDNIFVKITFSLKNGKPEVHIYNHGGCFYYLDCNGETLESISFNESNLTDMMGSFHKALKALTTFDRQYINTSKEVTNTSIDRASFGLAEVN
jgi:hypothetical protein